MTSAAPIERRLDHRPLGTIDYDTAWALQRRLRDARLADEGADVLITCEHSPPVLTAGRRALDANLRRTAAELGFEGVQVRRIERGGDWTWHGPGQLVGYPIVRLKDWGLKVVPFVGGLERAMAALVVEALRDAGVDADDAGLEVGRRCGFPGTWTRSGTGELAKVGAVGVHFRRFVSLHGLALNLDPDPRGFEAIVPCGLPDPVTSIRKLCEGAGGAVRALPSVAELGMRLAELLPRVWREPASARCATFE